jgi:hypothetical protein
VGLACESTSVRQVARQFRLAASTLRAIDHGISNGGMPRVARSGWNRWAETKSTSASR